MLPDFPNLKAEIGDVLQSFLRKSEQKHLGAGFNEMPRTTIHEGHVGSIIRASGKRDPTKMMKVSALLEIKRSEVPNLSLSEIFTRLDGVAREMAEKRVRQILAHLSDELEKAGQTLDAKGEKMSAALLLRLLDSIQIDFDKNGNPRLPSMIGPPAISPAAEAANRALLEDPEIVKQRDKVIARKREEWRAREADRRLVG